MLCVPTPAAPGGGQRAIAPPLPPPHSLDTPLQRQTDVTFVVRRRVVSSRTESVKRWR